MTQIQETTLRMWEKRYAFPKSTRTAGGHRLYSHREVLRLQWVKARLDEGMQVSQSIRALRQLEAENAIEFNETQLWDDSNRDTHAALSLQDHLFDALINHDKQKVDEILSKASVMFPIESIVIDLIRPVLDEIGEAWSRDDISVATEHFASHYLRQYLLTWMRVAPPSYDVPPVILVCAPGELHEGGLLMFAVLLGRLRWPIVYLGQTMPLVELAKFTQDMPQCVIVFSASSEETASHLCDWPFVLRKDSEQALLVTYGGRAFSLNHELAEKVPGEFLGDTIPAGVEKLNKILHQLYPKLY